MNLFENLLINSIYLVFPLLIYVLYQIYSKTLNKEKNELYLDIALISSFYLITQYGIFEQNTIYFLLLNIPLIVAYTKDRYLSVAFLSIMIIVYYYEHLNFYLIILVIEYLMYFITYLLLSKQNKKEVKALYFILFIKCIVFFVQLYYHVTDFEIVSILISIFPFYIETIILLYLLKKTEDILKLHKTIQELQEEKQVRESLFKITHEIKNPIAVCKGYLDMFDVNDVTHSRKYVPIIKSEIERVLILLQDFLSITKIKVELDIIDINMLLEDVINSFLPFIKDRKINLISHIGEDELYLMADYNRLSQVFVNLIKNSIEAIDNESRGQIEILVEETKNNVIVKLKDNGSGISSDNLKRMNEPFFTTKTTGTGLGVYLSTEIVKAHGGKIYYESNEEGTTATITLPNKKGY